MASNLDTLQALTRRYNNSQNEVKVKLAFQGVEVSEFMAKLIASLGGGQLPTMVYVTEGNAQRLIDSGAMAPVQEFIDQESYDLSDLDKKVVDYYTLDGKLWAMPFAVDHPLALLQQDPPSARSASTRRNPPRTRRSFGRSRRRWSNETPTAT